MARFLPQTLIMGSRSPLSHFSIAIARSPLPPSSSHLVSHRRRSDRPEILPVIDAVSAAPELEAENSLVARLLEEAVHQIIVLRSAPDWLPFVPGSSFWVPPRVSALNLVQIARVAEPLSDEEALSFTTARGWPSSAYFVAGVTTHPVKNNPGKPTAQSDDEES